VSACSSSPILNVVDQFGSSPIEVVTASADLLGALAAVPDPRARRGVRPGFVAILAVGVCAVLAGAGTFTAIAEWAHDLPVGMRVRLGLGRLAPSESTIRRNLQAVDADAVDGAISAWLVARAATAIPAVAPAVRMIAIDGKSARGARGPKGRAVHLLAAFDQANGLVLGQGVVDGKTNEITAFAPLLDRIDITGAIITADALHTQHRHADYLIGRGAHYVLTVKRNQPSLHRQLRALPWAQTPAVDVTRDKGHGRVESRTLKLAAVTAGIGFPQARLAIQLIRRRRTLTNHKWHTETVYALTDLPCNQIRADQITETIRGHWGMENRLHWIRDVVFARTTPRSAPETRPPSWPPCATSPSASTGSPAQPTSPQPAATSAATPTASCRYSHNSEINFAETLLVVYPDEGHGLSRPKNIEHATYAELAHYRAAIDS
jgi:predicted transposase YbfD/YdcC